MIKFEGVSKAYKEGAHLALDDVTFNVSRGEFVFIVGSSGSGKSTLLSLILRSERANEGDIQVAGRDLKTLTNWRVPQFRQQIGVVFQNFRLLDKKTVYENVAFALQVIGKTRREIKTLVPQALELVGLADKAERFPDQLSGGERQRVGIARAFVNKPLIILADEPTGNLDPATSADIMQVFESINKMGTTILMATHSEEIVNSFQKRVLELRSGKLVRDEENAKYISEIAKLKPVPQAVIHEEYADQLPTEVVPDISNYDVLEESSEYLTVKIPKIARKIGQEDINNIENPDSRSNEFALDSQDEAHRNDSDSMFAQYFDTPKDIFHSGAFDTRPVMNMLKPDTSKSTNLGTARDTTRGAARSSGLNLGPKPKDDAKDGGK
ncbi:MAG: cell division ATP-binding protein FtsE [Candidatus Ancillula sp.]|jgi:cell division transport system ATP-binding protein|nr:cell division ATP-binding protein FtsE [Candidatus Ancillula sp.]